MERGRKFGLGRPTWGYWCFAFFYMLDAITTVWGYDGTNEANPFVRHLLDVGALWEWFALKFIIAFVLGYVLYNVWVCKEMKMTKVFIGFWRWFMLIATFLVVVGNFLVIGGFL